ncbi:hypothetical protein Tco_0598881 [Tanacetum coccineum]
MEQYGQQQLEHHVLTIKPLNEFAFSPNIRLIHARMHAQALTLVVLSDVALYHHFGTSEEADHHDHRN